MPHVADTLAQPQGEKVLYNLDANSGFLQVPLAHLLHFSGIIVQ